MRPGFAKIIEKVRISTFFESPGTDLHIAENDCCIDYADTWSSKHVHWLSTSQSAHCGTIYYGCEDTLGFDTAVAWVSLPITEIHLRVAAQSKIQRLPATLYNTGWMDHSYVSHRSIQAIPILEPVDIDEAYSCVAACYQSLHWLVRSYGWR